MTFTSARATLVDPTQVVAVRHVVHYSEFAEIKLWSKDAPQVPMVFPDDAHPHPLDAKYPKPPSMSGMPWMRPRRDPLWMARHVRQMHEHRREVAERFEAFAAAYRVGPV